MALDLGSKKYINVIDRTVPEVYNHNKKLSRLDIIEFCWALKSIGVDMIEITAEVLKKIARLPKGIEFILRIASEEEIALLNNSEIRHVIVRNRILLSRECMKVLKEKEVKITVEFDADSFNDFYALVKKDGLNADGSLHAIRVCGMNHCYSPTWTGFIEKIRSKYNVKMDICPENRSYTATATALEGIMADVDYISLSFMGFGGSNGFAPLEEVLTAARILVNPQMKIELNMLPRVCKQFTKVTGIKIPENKPVIGKNIFEYESGVHADGIEKNPNTYEPFEPHMVGQKRKMTIGKHSGRKSIAKKLIELGIDFDETEIDKTVESIRQESIKMGRSLTDVEIVSLFYKNKVSCM